MHNGCIGALGCDTWAKRAAPEAAAAPPLLPVALAEVLGQQTAHLHAKHARFRATAAAGQHTGLGEGGAGRGAWRAARSRKAAETATTASRGFGTMT